MRTFELGEVIAERRLTFQANAGWARETHVRIGRPAPDPSDRDRTWVCPYQVAGLGHDRVMGIFGADAMQALLLAVHTIPVELDALSRDLAGRFLHHNHPDTGFVDACRSVLRWTSQASRPNTTSFFANVDLDIESSDDLTPLVRAFEPSAFSLERPPGLASFELSAETSPTTPEPLILEFVRLVNELPQPAREIWDRASRRAFDIGLLSGRRPHQEHYRLTPATLRAAADVDAEIAITVYALLPEDEADVAS
ncbi:MAG: DUF6968 family protein [Vicinamibacterales bacterium]